MPNIKSAKKRVKVIDKKTLQNKMIKQALKTAIKKFDEIIAGGDKTAATEYHKEVVKMIDQAGAKGLYHANTISRKKSALARKLNKIA